jgi:hypothetical protein
MIGRLVSIGIASVVIAGVLFLSPAGEDSNVVAQITPAAADAGDCKPAHVTASITRFSSDAAPTRAQQAEIQRWCATMDTRDTAPTAGGPGTITGGGGGTEIWCGKQVCACWKGKYYNGCHHLSVCSGELTCYGKVCVCKTNG